MGHVKHMGFELETTHAQIVRALAFIPSLEGRAVIIDHLKPKKLQDAVRETVTEAEGLIGLR